mgnify:CR=1 FL=1
MKSETLPKDETGFYGFEPADKTDFVDTIEFVNADVGREPYEEYIRVAIDRDAAEIRLYRAVGAANNTEYVGLVLEDARYYTRGRENPEPEGFDLHNNDATDLITWLTCLAKERSEAVVKASYYWKNNSPMIDKSEFDNESLRFSYDTETGRNRQIMIDSLRRNKQQALARTHLL